MGSYHSRREGRSPGAVCGRASRMSSERVRQSAATCSSWGVGA